MKTKSMLLTLILFMGTLTFATAQEKTAKATQTVGDKVEVYYFHYTRRCATCNAVEAVSKKAIADMYGEQVTFGSYNLDEETGESKGNDLAVSGQSLLIVAGDTKVNLTNEGFMNARTNPDKLKAILKENIDRLL